MTELDSDDGLRPTDELATAQSALRGLTAREIERHPLVVGLVAPLGVDLDGVVRSLTESFQQFGYSTNLIQLSTLLDDLGYAPLGVLPTRRDADYYEGRMNAGDRLREDVGDGSALAALAVARVASERADNEAPEQAFILRSLKHPAEAALLRHVYGDAFTLVGVASSPDERRNALVEKLALFEDARALAEKLIARDESDSVNKNGQNVRDVYAMADVFLPSARGMEVDASVGRFVDSLFGAPFLTPTAHEEGMRLASDASLRSAAVGRQVGAALIPSIGTPVVIGTNEVPRPGGGQYWSGDIPDYRDFQTGMDPNPLYTRRVVQELLERLAERGWLVDSLRDLKGPALLMEAIDPAEGESILKGARAAALIEFTRCLHAEQAAIINAARSGVATQNATLYTTTFPCHECAKMIVGAGIVEVQYIEPYPKSMVARLYRDLIDVAPPVAAEAGLVAGRVPFKPFVGFAPRRYAAAFTAGERRASGENIVEFERPVAAPRSDWNRMAVEVQEAAVVSAITRVLRELGAASFNVSEPVSGSQSEPATAKPAPRRKQPRPAAPQLLPETDLGTSGGGSSSVG